MESRDRLRLKKTKNIPPSTHLITSVFTQPVIGQFWFLCIFQLNLPDKSDVLDI